MTNAEELLLQVQQVVADLEAWMNAIGAGAGIYYLNNGVPYTSGAAAKAAIPLGDRTQYLTVNIAGAEYQFQPDLETLLPKFESLSIANNSLTLAKLINIPSGYVLYRKSAGSGPPEIQTLATLKEDLGIIPGADFIEALSTKVTYSEGYYMVTQAQLDSIAEIANKVVKVAGKSLVADTEITRLSGVAQNIYKLHLPAAGSVAGRISGATMPEGTTGWTIEVGESDKDLVINHGLDRDIAHITVLSINGDKKRNLKENAAYSGFEALDSNTLVINAFAVFGTEVIVNLIFS